MGRKVTLTDVGKRLIGYTEEILNTYGRIESIASDEKEVRGELKIATPESLTVYRLEPILSEYRKSSFLTGKTVFIVPCSENTWKSEGLPFLK
ncbi:LysR family transcriptional regulator [Brevibacillus brevis]|nr:LysR family transcriptional regulator [Brevibacillus brevis]